MEMVVNNGFQEMTFDEAIIIDAGGKLLDGAMAVSGIYSAAVGVAGYLGTTSLACAGACAAVAGAPVVAGTAAICGIVAAGYGVYTFLK